MIDPTMGAEDLYLALREELEAAGFEITAQADETLADLARQLTGEA